MATKKASKRKASHRPGKSAGYKSKRGGSTTRKRGGGKKVEPLAPAAPAEDPIIVGGGSVLLDFDKTFSVNDHPVKPTSRRRGRHPNASAKITQVVFLTAMDGTATRRFTLTAEEKAVAICFTGSSCP